MSLNSNLHLSKNKVLHLLVQGVHMCIYLHEISKVIPLVKLQPLPGSPSYFIGLMNLKGLSIPVMDMALRVGLVRDKNYTTNLPIILCHHKDKTAGFIVDEIKGLVDIDEKSVQVNAEFNHKDSLFIGAIVDNTEPSLLVNIPYLLESEAMLNQLGNKNE